ncbi:MAG: hypothetical protein IJW92_05965 [Clostridia bacterium]|nr:hypothetical protein [Clostridia bacterium]
MDKIKFYKILKENGIDTNKVCFDDAFEDDVFCVYSYHGFWDVFYRERGKTYNLKTFSSESAALLDLLKRLLPTIPPNSP